METRYVVLPFVGLGLMLALSGCGDSCDSLQDQVMEIGKKMQKDPSKASDYYEKLEKLRDELIEKKCGMPS